jgi:predicted lactoylglutathione lyase
MSVQVGTEANVKQAVPFFWVRDIHVSTLFYVDGLGFKTTNTWVYGGGVRWCWLELGEAALMLQEFWSEGPHKNLPETKLGVGVAICFQCRDALELYREFRSRGIDVKKPFVGNHMWVTEVVDPDGYRLLFESPTEVPEETEYTE